MQDRAMRDAIRLKREKNVSNAHVEGHEASDNQDGNGDIAPDALGHKANPSHDPRQSAVNLKKPLVPHTNPNEGRMMAGNGEEPRFDNMGVDEHKPLQEQGNHLTKELHATTSKLKHETAQDVGTDVTVDMSDPGPGDDVQEAHNGKINHYEKRPNESKPGHASVAHDGDYNDAGARYASMGKPMAAARERMKAMFAKRK